MRKFIKHIRRWNIWRKNCLNNKWHKFLVLIRVKESPTLLYVLLPEEKEEIDRKVEELWKNDKLL